MIDRLLIGVFEAFAPARAFRSAHEGMWKREGVRHPIRSAFGWSMAEERRAAESLSQLVKQGHAPEARMRINAINGLFLGGPYDSHRALGIANRSDNTWIYIGGAVEVKEVQEI